MTVAIGIAALVVAMLAVIYARRTDLSSKRSADSAERSAAASESSNRLAREPVLTISVVANAPSPADKAIYSIRNDGPQDLTSIVVYRPKPPDRIIYPIAVTGGPGGWADDEISLGPATLGQEVRFTLCCGHAEELPEFRVRIECEAGVDRWPQSRLLPDPRGAQSTAPYL
jgi:hypothetical protein